MINHPKQGNRFSVEFECDDEIHLDKIKILSEQLIKIEPFSLLTDGEKLCLIVEDDIKNEVSKAIGYLFNRMWHPAVYITIHLKLLDGNNEVLENYRFKECIIRNAVIENLDFTQSKSIYKKLVFAYDEIETDFGTY